MSEQETEHDSATEVPNFLVRLGLDESADARTIRRAYARLLKQIDQESQADVFQDLRAAYEVALQWADHQVWLAQQTTAEQAAKQLAPAQDAPLAVSDEAAAPLTLEQDPALAADPDLLSWEAFERFTAAASMLTQGRMLRDQSLWQDAITRELDDERLVNVTARTIFEARVVHLLSGGWQLGHDTLFAAACTVFGWATERRRLAQFGYAGSVVNRAIDERHMFEVQPDGEREMHQKILGRLTRTDPPDADQLRRDMFYLEQMLARFPTLMGLTVDPARVEQWRAMHKLVEKKQGKPVQIDDLPEPVLEQSSSSKLPVGLIIMGLLMLVRLLSGLSSDPAPSARRIEPRIAEQIAADPSFGKPVRLGMDPDYAPLLTALEKKEGAGQAARNVMPTPSGLTKSQLDEIGARIDYKRPASAGPAKLRAEFDVQLSLSGAVAKITRIQGSGDAGFDEAVEDAIGKSKPFPPATARKLRLYYTAEYKRRPNKAERRAEINAARDEAPARTAAPEAAQ